MYLKRQNLPTGKKKENTVFKNQPISQYICTCNHKDTIFEDKSLGIEK